LEKNPVLANAGEQNTMHACCAPQPTAETMVKRENPEYIRVPRLDKEKRRKTGARNESWTKRVTRQGVIRGVDKER